MKRPTPWDGMLCISTLMLHALACSQGANGDRPVTGLASDGEISDAAHDACTEWGTRDCGAADGSASDVQPHGPPDAGSSELDACADTDGRITVATLLRDMVDLGHLTRLPMAPYTTFLQSSHNVRSDTATPGDADWHADQDFIEPAPFETVTLLEVDGPGVITRLWSASPQGTLRIYIDGAAEPTVEAEFSELLRGDVEPFRPPFAFIAAYGHNLYFPIPFTDDCRITLTSANDQGVVYYHIAYRRYPEGTPIEAFSPTAVTAAQCAYERVADALREPRTLPTGGAVQVEFDLESGAGEALAGVIDAPQGGGVLSNLSLSPAQTEPDLLRATALVIEMDGEVTVHAPLLDFFAMGFDASDVQSLPVGVSSAGVMTSRWLMPFQRQARVWIEHANEGEIESQVSALVASRPWTDQSLYLYAGWHPPALVNSAPALDRVLAEAVGAGYFVGNTLNILNPSVGWWGEGDERIYVDNETFPSHFGTGTEDYYGYAWCSNETFSTPYIGQTSSTSHESFGHASLYRFHVIDAIPFRKSLRFDLEVRHWGEPVEMTYDSMSVWYARPGARVSGARLTDGAFRLPALTIEPPDGVRPGPYRCGG